jgi:anti-anti-sigma factor
MVSSRALQEDIVRDDTVVITTGSSLDNNNAHEMVDAILAAQSRGFATIVIDMRALEFLSSAGVGAILGTVEASREAGGDIVLCNASRNIMHVFSVLDLAEFLTIKETRDQAVRAT